MEVVILTACSLEAERNILQSLFATVELLIFWLYIESLKLLYPGAWYLCSGLRLCSAGPESLWLGLREVASRDLTVRKRKQ